jgi:hypothetical protein
MRTHTGPRFIVSSEGRESHQPQVIRASHTNSKILVPEPGREPRTFRIGVGRATTAPLALSTFVGSDTQCLIGFFYSYFFFFFSFQIFSWYFKVLYTILFQTLLL